jgi:hypothetical protein
MAGRSDLGWMRFGLPGMALGMVVTWGWAIVGDRAAAQGPGTTSRPASGGSMQGRPMPSAGAQPAKGAAVGEAGGILALVSSPQGTGPAQWLYLIDTKKRAFAIYRVDPTNPQGCVKLEASRQFRWDLDLDQYNNQGLEPADVKARVDAVNRSNP